MSFDDEWQFQAYPKQEQFEAGWWLVMVGVGITAFFTGAFLGYAIH